MQRLIDAGHAYAGGRLGDVYFDVRSLAGVRRADPASGSTTWSRPRTPTRAASATRATSRCGRRPSRRAETASWPTPVGAGPAGLAPRVLGDGRASTSAPAFDIHGGGLDLRLPAPRERAGAVARGRRRLRPLLAAQRLGHHRRREDEQVARQLAARRRGARSGSAPRRAALLPRRGALPLARSSTRDEALDEAAAGFRRIEGVRASGRAETRRRPARAGRRRVPPEFVAAMDDDLGVPAALAVVHDDRPRGQHRARRRATAATAASARVGAARCPTCSALDPLDPPLGRRPGAGRAPPRAALDALVGGLLDAAAARPRAAPRLRGRRRDPRPAHRRGHRRRGHPRRRRAGRWQDA